MLTNPRKPAIFLDRDGTLIHEKHYLHRPEEVEFFAEAAPALKRLSDAGFALVVVTNQSGVGRGYFTGPMSTGSMLTSVTKWHVPESSS
jgi:HAD superfamily hydrolase (TIGR01662 family)